jgi:hypothetical protein
MVKTCLSDGTPLRESMQDMMQDIIKGCGQKPKQKKRGEKLSQPVDKSKDILITN